MRDFYKDLGLSDNATEAEIKSAYRKLAKTHHPDRKGGDAERFKEVSEAYEVLSDKEKRQQYDHMKKYGHAGPGAGQGMGGFHFDQFSDMGDIFSNLFGDFHAGAQHNRPRRGRDNQVSIDIPFTTAILGGKVSVENSQGKRLEVTIPEGIVSGSRLRLRGQGSAGSQGASHGDLHVEVNVAAHPTFWREGRHVVSNLKIDYIDFILGKKCHIPTVHGDVQLTVPPGLQAGDRLRVRGYGVRGKGMDGDHYVVVNPSFPKKINAEEKELIVKLRELRDR